MRKLCSLIGMSILSLSSTAYASDHSKKAQPIDQWLDQVHLNNLSISNQSDQKLLHIKRHLVNFYRNTTIDKSFVDDNGVTVDCIPFKKQLALIDQPQSFIDQAYHNYQLHGPSAPQDTRCPVGDVLMARPLIDTMNSHDPSAFFKNPPKDQKSQTKPSNNQKPPRYVYNWVQTPYRHFNTDWDIAYASLSMGSKPSLASYSSFGHSLGQMWVLTDGNYDRHSLEAGIVRDVQHSTEMGFQPTFFIFASVDGYGQDSCYNGLCGHFIQFPNTPLINDIPDTPSHILGYHGPTDIYTFAFRQAQQDDNTHRYNYYLSRSNGVIDPAENKTQLKTDTLGYYDFSTADVDTSNPQYFKKVSAGGELVVDEAGYPKQTNWDMGTGSMNRHQQDLNTAAIYTYGYSTGFFTQKDPNTISFLTRGTDPIIRSQYPGKAKCFHGDDYDLTSLNAWPYQHKPAIPDTIKSFNKQLPLGIMAYGGSLVH